jgi:thiosulfate/3-mercaptopyruvate sulfurtransferase
VDFEDVGRLPDGTVLLDARSAARYRGEPHPLDARPGHIPGARSAPWDANLGPDGRFKPADELRRRFQELGVDRGEEVVAYCGSGVSACHDLLALELAGLPGARLYPGSWSDWAAREGTPAETG